jgi:hypothetical protein
MNELTPLTSILKMNDRSLQMFVIAYQTTRYHNLND